LQDATASADLATTDAFRCVPESLAAEGVDGRVRWRGAQAWTGASLRESAAGDGGGGRGLEAVSSASQGVSRGLTGDGAVSVMRDGGVLAMGQMAEPMEDEFGTMARWTVEAVTELGPAHAVPAGCRGSGTPAVLDWLLERLDASSTTRLLDVGAGLGGPAAYGRGCTGLRAVCVDPMRAASEGARSLFGLPAVVGDAAQLPLADAAFDAAWSLGTLCTTEQKGRWLGELRRVLRDCSALGLLVLVGTPVGFATSWGNAFPTDDELTGLVERAGFAVTDREWSASLPEADERWQSLERAVDDAIARRHGHDARYGRVKEQEEALGHLLDEGRIRGRLLVARACP
jgi:SAM-dependent methyltransferase